MPLTTIPSSPLLATATAPGAESPEHYAATELLRAGNLSATQNRLLSAAELAVAQTQSPGGWASQQIQRMSNIVPSLAYSYYSPESLLNGLGGIATGITDANANGGGIALASLGNVTMSKLAVLNNPRSGTWAFTVRCTLPTGAGVRKIGLLGGTREICLYTDGSQTRGQVYDGSVNKTVILTFTPDALAHDFCAAFDGTVVRFLVDGTILGTVSDLTSLADANMKLYAYVATSMVVYQAIVGVVAP